MIRIDLSKEDLGGKSTDLRGLLTEKLGIGKNFKLGGQTIQLSTVLVLIGALIGSCLPYVGLGIYKDFTTRRLREQKLELQEKLQMASQEIQKLMPYQRELETFELQKRQVNDRLGAIRALMNARGTPVNVLDAVAQSMPKRVWLSNMEVTFEEAGGKVALQGSAIASEDISDYVDRLSESLFVSDVSLEDISSGKQGTSATEVKLFHLSAKPKARVPASEIK